MGDVLRMIGARLRADSQLRHQHCAREFGDEFFDAIGLVSKALAELSVQSLCYAGGMTIMPSRGLCRVDHLT